MSDDHDPVSVRIVLAIKGSSEAVRLLAEATDLARSLRAELAGLFVEETDLLRIAGLPMAREIGVTTGDIRDIEPVTTARLLQRQAEAVRNLVAQTAASLDLPWSFRVTRGNIVEAALTAATASDLVMLAPPPGAVQHILGTATPGRTRLKVAVWFDGTVAAERALAAAEDLVRYRAESVSLVVPTGYDPDEMRRHAAALPGGYPGLSGTLRLEDLHSRSGLTSIVIPIGSLADEAELRRILARATCPVILVR